MPTLERRVDTLFEVGTPEGVTLRLSLAGPVPRALAWLVDFAWRVALLFVIAMSLAFTGEFGLGLFLLAWFLLEWLVPAWLEYRYDGQTPGKRALGIAVVRDDGTPLDFGAALNRNLMRFVDFLPLFYVAGVISIVLTRDFKRLGDLTAGTVVVHRARGQRTRPATPMTAVAPPRPLALSEARALLALADRAPELGPARLDELAAIDLGLGLDALAPSARSARLLAIAAHLRGGDGEGR